MKFSVLMSVYIKENPNYLKEALFSLQMQTRKADEYVFVKDGSLTPELNQVLDDFHREEKDVKFVELKKNRGLGLALREGVNHCSYEWIARIDSDDIAVKERFEKQISFIEKNPDVSIVGTWIEEFDNDDKSLRTITKLPISNQEIKSFMKKRNPFRHMTVMYKKMDVLSVGNYRHFLWFEDYDLFVRLINGGFKGHNIPKILMKVRVGKEMIKRRGGFSYIKTELQFLFFMYRQGIINLSQLLISGVSRSMVRLMPGNLRIIIYNKMLREPLKIK